MEKNSNSQYFDPSSDEDGQEENQSFLVKNDEENSQNKKNQSTKYLKNRKESSQDQSVFERFCILFVFIGLLIVLFIICTILIQTFKAEEIQRQQEFLMKQPIIKPLTDNKEYKTLILKNNLKVVLVNDPDTTLSYAAMDVNAGSWVEPTEIPGLAHYLEHMLFLASETYNTTAFFDNFLSQNGGSSNAYTTDLHTNYFFHINTKAFQQGLSIFSHMFIDPLFVKEQSRKEASNVESEYQIDINTDGWQLQNLINILCKKSHPMSRFTIGTVDTLINNTEKQGIDVVEALEKFFKQNYSSNLMSLVLYSNESIDKMEQFLESAQFENIGNKNLKHPNMTHFGLPLENDNKKSLFKIKTNSGQKSLNIVYEIELNQDETKRGLEYAFTMINQQGEGSFVDKLKSTGFIMDMSFDVLHKEQNYVVFQLEFDITDLGFQSPGLIINFLNTYLKKIGEEGIRKDLYDDMKVQAQNEFEYQLQQQGQIFDEKVSSLASYANQYKIPNILVQDYLYEEFDQDYIKQFIDKMQEENNSLYILGSNTFFSTSDKDQSSDEELEDLEESENQELVQNLNNELQQSQLIANFAQAKQQQQKQFFEKDIIGQHQDFLNENEKFEYNELFNLKYSKLQLDSQTIQQLFEINQEFYDSIVFPEKNEYIPKNKDLVNMCEDNIIQENNNNFNNNQENNENNLDLDLDEEQVEKSNKQISVAKNVFLGSKYVLDLQKELNQQLKIQEEEYQQKQQQIQQYDDSQDVIENQNNINNNNNDLENLNVDSKQENIENLDLNMSKDNIDDIIQDQTQNQKFLGKKEEDESQQNNNDGEIQNNTNNNNQKIQQSGQLPQLKFEVYTNDYFKKFLYKPFLSFEETLETCKIMEKVYLKDFNYPQLIAENAFYKMQTDYQTPYISYMMQLSIQKKSMNLKAINTQLKLKILGEILQVQLQKDLAQPLNVDYNLEISTLFGGYSILLEGWNDKFNQYTDKFLESFEHLQIKNEQFLWAKNIIETTYEEFQELDPLHQAFQISLHELIVTPAYHYTQYLEAIQKINLVDIQEFFEEMKMNLTVKSLIIGNLLPLQAYDLNQKITSFFLRENAIFQQINYEQNLESQATEFSQEIVNKNEDQNEKNSDNELLILVQTKKSKKNTQKKGKKQKQEVLDSNNNINEEEEENLINQQQEDQENNLADASSSYYDSDNDTEESVQEEDQEQQQQIQQINNKNNNNIDDDDLQDINQKTKTNQFLFSAPSEKVYNLKGQSYVYKEFLYGNEDNLNSATINYYQYGQRTLTSFSTMHLLVDLLNSHVYNYLRTERELGYVAFCMMVTHGCVDGYVIGIEGSKAAPDVVDEMIEQSLFSFATILKNLNDEEFENLKDSVMKTLQQNPKSLNQEIKQYFDKISEENYVFDLNKLVQIELEKLSKQDLVNLFEKIFKNEVGKFSVQRYSNNQNLQINRNQTLDAAKSYSNKEQVMVNDISEFKNLNESNSYKCTISS